MTGTAAVLAAAFAAGCADPYAAEPTGGPGTPPGELPAAPVPQPAEDLERLPRSPEAAARRAAELTITWTGANAARRYGEFASFATGAARRHAREAAARLPTDPLLDGASSAGEVAAIVTRATTRTTREMLVVTRETLRADDVTDRRWRVTLVGVERRSGGWAVTRWEPQP